MKTKILFITLFSITPYVFSEINLNEDKAWQIAISNNQYLKSIEYNKQQSKYSYLTSINSYLPQISLNNSFSRSGGDYSLTGNRFSLGASLNQNLLDLKSLSSIKVSKLSYEISQINYEIALANLRQNLFLAYYNLYFAQESIKVNKRIKEIREENYRLIKLKYESGMESKGDMFYAKAQYEMAVLSLKKSERSLEVYMDILAQQLGMERKDAIIVEGELIVSSFTLDNSKDYLNYYPDFKIYEKNLNIAKEKFYSSKYNAYPTLDFNSSISYSGKSELPQNQSWSMSVSLNLPIFSNGLTYYSNNKKSFNNALKSAEKNLEWEKISFHKDLKASYVDFLNANDTAFTYKTLMLANEERYKEAQIKYMAGKMSFIDLENLEQNMIDSNLNYLQFLKDLRIKKINLERYLGIIEIK